MNSCPPPQSLSNILLLGSNWRRPTTPGNSINMVQVINGIIVPVRQFSSHTESARRLIWPWSPTSREEGHFCCSNYTVTSQEGRDDGGGGGSVSIPESPNVDDSLSYSLASITPASAGSILATNNVAEASLTTLGNTKPSQ